jgi:hypothetical protein
MAYTYVWLYNTKKILIYTAAYARVSVYASIKAYHKFEKNRGYMIQ